MSRTRIKGVVPDRSTLRRGGEEARKTLRNLAWWSQVEPVDEEPRNPMPDSHRLPKWAVQQIRREHGVIEDLCQHGVGHPNRDWLVGRDPVWREHGCDSCCAKRGPDAD